MNVDYYDNGKLNLRKQVIGIDELVPLLDGRRVPYVYLDNAASTPALSSVMEAVNSFLPHYSSVHRGTGFKSRLSTKAYDRAHEVVAAFVGADRETNTVIFGKNATEAINKLSYRLPMNDDSVIISTQLEHHSNDLPWRRRASVVHIRARPDGRLDEEEFDQRLQEYAGKVSLVAVTGTSNVTGYLQPIHRLARKAHDIGAKILVDAAQMAPHRQVDMKPDDDPEHLDFVVLSAHKMYAPFGTGALIGPKNVFLDGPPEYPGGGTVDIVTLDEVYWAGTPDRDEAGSPNVVGAVALAVAAKSLMDIGMDKIAAHEAALVQYTLRRLREVPEVQIYGESDPEKSNGRAGVIPFNIQGHSHFKVASILGYEGGIGVRSGCFCAHPYVVHLLQLSDEQSESWRSKILNGDRSEMPGLVRVSFGCYNNEDDIDRLIEMLSRIAAGGFSDSYELNRATGEYIPRGHEDLLEQYFSI